MDVVPSALKVFPLPTTSTTNKIGIRIEKNLCVSGEHVGLTVMRETVTPHGFNGCLSIVMLNVRRTARRTARTEVKSTFLPGPGQR